MKFTFEVNFLRFDISQFSEELKAVLIGVAKDAAEKYVKVIESRVPQYTGFLRGAFRPIEQGIGRFVPSLKSPTTSRKLYYQHVLRTPANGQIFATPKDRIFGSSGRNNISETSILKPGFIVLFDYEVDISYYQPLDEARWHSRELAEEAFKTHLAFNLRIPELRQFLYRVNGKVGSNLNL
jgi:hypothetical protein